MPAPAALFDIDGTLVDSNYLHVRAWSVALRELDRPAGDWRIHRCIGMDSAKLMDELLGQDADEKLRESAKKAHEDAYAELSDQLRVFDRARELLSAIRSRGWQVVLATSAPPDELKKLLEVLDVDDIVNAITSADDVDQAKPEPDLMHRALDKAGVDAEQALMVGDTIWDGHSAAKAGVPFVGVRSGGIGGDLLRGAGAIAVYDDPAELLAQLDRSPFATR